MRIASDLFRVLVASLPISLAPLCFVVSLTSLATTAQFAAQEEHWGEGVFAVEIAVAQICREGGARVVYLDIAPFRIDGRQLEVVDPVWGMQLALDATVVSPIAR